MANCVEDESLQNKVLPIGGPGEALTPLQQGNMLFEILDKKPFFIKVLCSFLLCALLKKIFSFMCALWPGFGGIFYGFPIGIC